MQFHIYGIQSMERMTRLGLATPSLEGWYSSQLSYIRIKTAEHPIGTLSPCGTSIVSLLVEFEPLTIAIIIVLHQDHVGPSLLYPTFFF